MVNIKKNITVFVGDKELNYICYMKLYITIIILVCFTFFAKSQDSTDVIKFHKKINYGVIVGSHFNSFSKDNYSFGTYTIPFISYSLTPKTSLNAGLLLGNNYNYFKNTSDVTPYNSISGNFLYLSAKHQVNDRLIIAGSVIMNTSRTYNSEMNNFNKNIQSSSIGFDYKISDHLFFGTEFNFSNGHNTGIITKNSW